MKINFKKIASVLASTALLSSTLALAAAANYPAPFVQNGNADVAIVYGSAPGAEFDLVAVTDINSNLAAALAAQTATSGSTGGSSSVSGGDYVKLERSSDKFNLGESADDFYASLDVDELSAVLADGVYQNDDNNEYDFTQKIQLSSSLALEHFQDSDFMDDKPVIGFNLADGDHVLNYTLDFTPDAVEGGTGFVDLETTDLTLLGRTYYVVQAQNVSGSPKLTLLDSANSAIIIDGETSSITVGSNTYSVAINFIDSDETILTVDGVQTNKLQEGDVFKVAKDTYVAVKNVLYDSKDNGISKAEISIGSGKIVLQNNTEVKINNEDVSDIDKYNDAELKAYMFNTGENIDKIVLEWTLGDDTFVAAGSDLTLPGFETIKISMGAFNTPNVEKTTVENDGDDSIKLTTHVEDGQVSFNLLQANASGFHLIGKDSNRRLITLNETIKQLDFDTDTDEWFVASWINGDDAESYVLTVSDVTSSDAAKNTTTVKSVASGSTLSRDLDIGESEDFGRVRLKLNRSNDNSNNATFTISAAGGAGSVYFDRLYTKEGLKIQLPVSGNTSANPGQINLSTTNSSFVLQLREEDEDGTIDNGGRFNATLGLNSDSDVQVSSISVTDYETEDSSDIFEGYVNSSIASKTMLKTSGDQDTLDIEYHGEESFADVYVAESGAAVSSEGTAVSNSGSVKTLGSILVKDNEVASVSTKNLIVVGGSCVNSLAKELLGGAGCGSDFEQKTGVGAGSFLIQSFSRTGGKVATLVAGYNAGDTASAAKVLTSQSIDASSGKKYKGTGSTVAMVDTTSTVA